MQVEADGLSTQLPSPPTVALRIIAEKFNLFLFDVSCAAAEILCNGCIKDDITDH